MALTTIDQARAVVTRMGLTRFHAYDSAGNTLEHAETETAGELCDLLDELVRNNSGTMRVEAWQAAPVRKVGQRKADMPKANVERMAWHIRGLLGAPVVIGGTQPRAEAAAPATGILDVETAVKVARMEWENARLQQALDAALADAGDEPDEPEQPATPQPVAGLFGMTPQQTYELLAPLSKAVLPLLTSKLIPQPIGGTGAPVATPTPAGVSAEEMEMLQAYRRFQAIMPEEAKGTREQLLNNFGENPTPGSHGSAAQ